MSEAFDDFSTDLSERPMFYLSITGGIVAWMVLILGAFALVLWIMRRKKLRKDQHLATNYAILAKRVGENFTV
jgi:uncharacterized membrane protein